MRQKLCSRVACSDCEWKKAEECEKDVKQAEYQASRKEAKRCIARIQAEVMKKQAETYFKKLLNETEWNDQLSAE